MKMLLASLLIGLASAQAGAASFDCRLANAPIDKQVCADKGLSKLDEEMGASYQRALASTKAAARKELVKEQKEWLRASRSLCTDVHCLRRAYETRLLLLRECREHCVNWSESYRRNGEDYNLLIPRDTNMRNASFTEDLLKRGHGRVAGCESLVWIALGTASGNNSFGGLCKIGRQDRFVMVCNDDMIGHFKLAAAAPAVTRRQLIDFTIDNCYGG